MSTWNRWKHVTVKLTFDLQVQFVWNVCSRCFWAAGENSEAPTTLILITVAMVTPGSFLFGRTETFVNDDALSLPDWFSSVTWLDYQQRVTTLSQSLIPPTSDLQASGQEKNLNFIPTWRTRWRTVKWRMWRRRVSESWKRFYILQQTAGF